MTPEYLIFGEIGFDMCRAEPLHRFLSDNPGPVHVRINSPGGIATEGAAMLAEIERHGNVTVRVTGIAASAASLLMVGGKRIVVHRDAHLMLHQPSAMSWGTAADLRKAADVLDLIGQTYAQAYARHTGNALKAVTAWMLAETWLDASEALALHFADEIEGDGEAEPVARFDYTKFRHPPAQLAKLSKLNGWAAASPKTRKKDTEHA
jgi:ATP-dependent protease ClpP protease subunit